MLFCKDIVSLENVRESDNAKTSLSKSIGVTVVALALFHL